METKQVTVARAQEAAKESMEIAELLKEVAVRELTQEDMEKFYAKFAGIAYSQAYKRLDDALALGIEVDDFKQIAVMELLEGINRFELERGAAMAAYLVERVEGMLRTELRDEFRRQVKVTKSRKATTEKTEESEDIYTLKEVDVESYRTADCEDFNPLDLFACNTHTPEYDMERAETKAQLAEAMTTLTALEREVIQLHFLEEKPLKNVAYALNISVPRSHQIKAAALVRMKEFLTTGTAKPVQVTKTLEEREYERGQRWYQEFLEAEMPFFLGMEILAGEHYAQEERELANKELAMAA